MKAGPFKTKKDAVEAGLKLLARQAAYREILKWGGKLKWEGDESIDWTQPPQGDRARGAAEPRRGSSVLVVDSSVWIDFFNGAEHPAVEMLQQLRTWARCASSFPTSCCSRFCAGFASSATCDRRVGSSRA